MISGKTTVIGHIGYPTEAFKAPLIYNPWFEKNGAKFAQPPRLGFRHLYFSSDRRGALDARRRRRQRQRARERHADDGGQQRRRPS